MPDFIVLLVFYGFCATFALVALLSIIVWVWEAGKRLGKWLQKRTSS